MWWKSLNLHRSGMNACVPSSPDSATVPILGYFLYSHRFIVWSCRGHDAALRSTSVCRPQECGQLPVSPHLCHTGRITRNSTASASVRNSPITSGLRPRGFISGFWEQRSDTDSLTVLHCYISVVLIFKLEGFWVMNNSRKGLKQNPTSPAAPVSPEALQSTSQDLQDF